jgi:hypothetical protein
LRSPSQIGAHFCHKRIMMRFAARRPLFPSSDREGFLKTLAATYVWRVAAGARSAAAPSKQHPAGPMGSDESGDIRTKRELTFVSCGARGLFTRQARGY